jgi:histidinol-phosphate/aromatic aminotransferase/cobyric acid decarboxylase-like protein
VITLPAPGEHGDDVTRVAAALGVAPDAFLDLAVNLNPAALGVAVPLVAKHAEAVRHYPDAHDATVALAATLRCDPDHLVLTNGAAEAIALVAARHPVGAVDEPEFALYRRHLTRVAADGLRWRSNPNNPTGALAAPGTTADVWDESFFALATGRWQHSTAARYVIASLTKTFACPGLRMGYVLCTDPSDADALRALQPRWSVDSLVCAVLPELLARADIATWSTLVAEWRDELEALLASHGLEARPASRACFVLLEHAPGLRAHLAERLVLVRDTASFGITDGTRIAVPNPAGLDRLAAALKGYER